MLTVDWSLSRPVAIALRGSAPLFIKSTRNCRRASGPPSRQRRRLMTSFDHNMRSRSFRLLLKRGFDIVVSAAGLIVLSPLFLLTSLAIKLETRGSIFSSRLEFCYNDQ